MKGYRLDLFLAVVGLLVGFIADKSIGTAIVFAGFAMLICSACILAILFLVLTVQTVKGMHRDAAKTKRTLLWLAKQRDVHLNLLYGVAPVVGALMIFGSSHIGGMLSDINLMYFGIGSLITIAMNVVSLPPELDIPAPVE
jgi:uncharacterized membrane protein YhdT